MMNDVHLVVKWSFCEQWSFLRSSDPIPPDDVSDGNGGPSFPMLNLRPENGNFSLPVIRECAQDGLLRRAQGAFTQRGRPLAL